MGDLTFRDAAVFGPDQRQLCLTERTDLHLHSSIRPSASSHNSLLSPVITPD
jgi:hypothetical protein